MLRTVTVFPATPSFSADKTEAREAVNQVQGHLLESFRICYLGIFLIHGHFLPNSLCPIWAEHERLSLEAREHCHILFLLYSSFDWVIN